MNDLMILNISGIECFEKDGTAYLKLETVARGLGFTKTEIKNGVEYNTVRWERVFGFLDEIGFDHKWAKDGYIPENVFYRLAMKAKNETAEKFQAKIADEVIPSIRRHGAYMTSDTIDKMINSPEFGIKLLTALKDEQDKRKSLEAELDRSKEWYSIKRVAHMNGVSHKAFDWRKLKIESQRQGSGVKKIFDANYGTINVYHMNVWEKVYPLMEL